MEPKADPRVCHRVGDEHGSRSFAVADWHSYPDHPADLVVRWPELMADVVQILVLKRRGKWSVKAGEHEQTFCDQLAAIKAGIELANETGKNGKPSAVLFQAAKSRYNKVWTYGLDPYPPAHSGLPAICAASPVLATD
jgi:hypothetical protein